MQLSRPRFDPGWQVLSRAQTHNAGVEGSISSLSTKFIKHLRRPSPHAQSKVRQIAGDQIARLLGV